MMMNKSTKKIVTAYVITACILAGPFGMTALAEKPQEKVKAEKKPQVEKALKQEKEKPQKEWQVVRDTLIAEKEKKELQKDQFEAEKDELEKQAEEAKNNGNVEVYQELIGKIQELKLNMELAKNEMKSIQMQMKEVVRNKYTQEEMEQLHKVMEEIQAENTDVTIIPVENILTKGMNIKFDTPPVIKAGRTLIPVRAITEGFGAKVDWNSEDKIVTVTKGEVEIVFHLADGKVFVNGEEKSIDVPGQIMNNRTIVPLRFIIENFGLKVDYDNETGIIEIDEEEDQTVEEHSDGAVGGDTTTEESTGETDEAKPEVNTETDSEDTEEGTGEASDL